MGLWRITHRLKAGLYYPENGKLVTQDSKGSNETIFKKQAVMASDPATDGSLVAR